MKNKEILSTLNGLHSCGNLTGVTFCYFVAKNMKTISQEFETIQEQIKKLQIEHSKKDENDEPIIEKNEYIMKDLNQFQEKYKELMEIDTTFEIHKIKKENLPENITAQQLHSIFDLIEE